MAAPAFWLVAVQALALAGLPLSVRAFRDLPDLGHGCSKMLSVVVVGYTAWLLSMLDVTGFDRAAVSAVAAAIGLVCWWRWGAPCLGLLRSRWRLVAAMELVFLATFVAALTVRAYNADIVGQEKFMDLAFMNTFLTAADLPAEDAWLAGFGVPYYHLGYLILAIPAKIAGTPAAVAYNLAVAFVFAATVSGSMSVVTALTTAERSGAAAPERTSFTFALLGGGMVSVLGNLAGPLELIAARGWGSPGFWDAVGVRNLVPAVSDGLLPNDAGWWWRSSRVIPNIEPDGITEFPFFSFLLGDLHPHYMALPLDLILIALSITVCRAGLHDDRPIRIALAGVVLGVLVAANTWDVPTFWGLFGAVSALALWRRCGIRATFAAGVPSLLAPFALAVVAIGPYFVGYQSQPLGLGLVTARTPIASLTILFGPMLLVALTFSAWLLWCRSSSVPSRERGALWSVALTFGTLLTITALGEPTLATLLAVGVLLACVGRLWFREPPVAGALVSHDPLFSSTAFTWILLSLGAAVLIVVEIVFLNDAFGTRMNTVFKFHYNAWLLMSLGGAAALGIIWQRSGTGVRHGWRALCACLVVLVCGLGLVYPLGATWTKSAGFRGEPTLDGERFLRVSQPGDHAAIQWLRANATGRPVVVEAVGPDYGEFARVSTFSGQPTIVGWIGHELQWRGPRPELDRRPGDVDAIYRAQTVEQVRERSVPHRARYLFFGSLERTRYGAETEQRLGMLLPIAYSRQGTTIYTLPEPSANEAAR